MSSLEVLTFPNPFLKTTCLAVTTFDSNLKVLLEQMAETMYDSVGIGLAATQIGSDQRMFVMDVEQDEEDGTRKPIFLVNPVIVKIEGEQVMEEGCLSVPEFRADVVRGRELDLEYQDETGAKKKLHAFGLTAVCIQHEMDHLDGVLFIDHLSPLRRKMIQKKLMKLAKLA